MIERTCRRYGGFDPDIRHRTQDGNLALAIVARGMAVTLLPEFAVLGRRPGITLRPLAEGSVHRSIFAVTRAADAKRPSTKALLAAVRHVTSELSSGAVPSAR